MAIILTPIHAKTLMPLSPASSRKANQRGRL
jgi:hypothetical protein